jgi:hypothetical protein
MEISTVREFSAGQYIELIIYHNNGAPMNTVSTVGRKTTLSATWLAPHS